MLNSHSNSNQIGQIECPRCGKHTVVEARENLYQCLNCNFHRNISKHERGSEEGLSFFLAAVITVLLLIALI